MKTIATIAAAALAFGLSGTASASTIDQLGPQISADQNVTQAGYYWYYTQGWRGNCFYKYIYVTNGYRYAYRWRRTCY